MAIPAISVSPIFAGPSAARDQVDAAIINASAEHGFMTVTDLPADIPLSQEMRRRLLKIFDLPEVEQHKLWRQKFAPENQNVYRGWFPRQDGELTSKEGIDIGPDVAYGAARWGAGDPLREPTPLPDEQVLAGWRDAASTYYRAMERTGQLLMRSIARGLGLPEMTFDPAFVNGISTLRLLHYPPRTAADLAKVKDPGVHVRHRGEDWYVCGRAHADSGLLTLLAQDGVEGLQARNHDGDWLDVPCHEGSLAINFGKVLEKWTGGRLKATEHRVIGSGKRRYSVPFFYEPAVDAEIAPLPGGPAFEPVLYGDHLWKTTTGFVEFRGMENLRPPQR